MHSFDGLLDRVGILSASVDYRYFNFGGKALYLAGFSELLELSQEIVVFRLKGGKRITIKGYNLALSEMDKEIVIIVGKILIVEVQ